MLEKALPMKISIVALFAVLLTAAAGVTSARADILIGVPVPMSGPNSSMGYPTQRTIAMAVPDLNNKGGVLGQRLRILVVDDYCDADQAVAAAHKLVDAGVVLVVGHDCSGAAIPASRVYAAAGILMFTSGATNPTLTEQGLRNVFRTNGRDDEQGRIAGDYLADHWSGKRIAIVHDGQVYGKALAEETKKRLNERGITEAFFEAITPGVNDYSELVNRLKAAGIDILYFGGYGAEAGLILREARDAGSKVQLFGGDGINDPSFWQITGPAGEGALLTNSPDVHADPQVVLITKKYGLAYGDLDTNAYAAIQIWGQAAEKARSLQFEPMISTLRHERFDTILGRIGFDAKGDLTGIAPFVLYTWKAGWLVPTNTAKMPTQ
jgi:branched-chain amino acid transport system substrate-binding protein